MESKYDDQIDRFLHNKMSKEEQQQFKQQIDSNSEVRKLVQEQVLMIRAIHETQTEKDKAIIDSVRDQQVEAHPKRNLYVRYLAMAASVALLIVVGHDLFYAYSAHQLAGELSSQSMAQYRSMTMRGAEDEDVASLGGLFSNVEQGENLESTIEKLSELYAASRDEYVDAVDDYSTQIGMELAVAYYKSGEKDKAVEVLDTLIVENLDNIEAVQLRKYIHRMFL